MKIEFIVTEKSGDIIFSIISLSEKISALKGE